VNNTQYATTYDLYEMVLYASKNTSFHRQLIVNSWITGYRVSVSYTSSEPMKGGTRGTSQPGPINTGARESESTHAKAFL